MRQLTEKEQSLFNDLIKRKRDHHEVLQFYPGIWQSIIEKYPESAHFIYELLQNADDACATKVRVELNKDGMVFAHNGTIHFSISKEPDKPTEKVDGHINAIVGAGASTKSESDGTNKIGKFGVGFKSVFSYTERPEIYDDKFRFAIENYIIPAPLSDDYDGRQEGETLFHLPFKNPKSNYAEIKEKLLNLDDPILFLHHLKEIEILLAEDETRHIYTKNVLREKKGELKSELLELDNCGLKKYIWLFTKGIKIENANQYISVGFRLTDNKKQIDVSRKNGKVFCFFPTRETFNLCFMTHAPFFLTESRQNLKDFGDDGAVNKYLKNELAILCADSLVKLRDIGKSDKSFLLNDSLFHIIPQDNDIFFNAIVEKMREEPLLLSRGKKYLLPDNCYITSDRLMRLISKKQLQMLTNEDSCDFLMDIKGEVQSWVRKIFQEELTVTDYTNEIFASQITSAFMIAQDFEWVKRFYGFLASAAIKQWNADTPDEKPFDYVYSGSSQHFVKTPKRPFRFAPIVNTTRREWVSPYKEGKDSYELNVFFKNTIRDNSLNFVAKPYADDPKTRHFLEAIGIKDIGVDDYIENAVFTRYAPGRFPLDNDVVRDDLRVLAEHRNNGVTPSGLDDYISKVKENVWLKGHDGKSSVDNFYRPTKLYDDDPILRDYFGEEGIPFVNYEFYEAICKTDDEKKSLRSFLKELVLQTPLIKQDLNTSDRWDVPWKIRYKVENNCGYDRTSFYWNKGVNIVFYTAEGFENAVQNNRFSHSTSVWLWSLLEEKHLTLSFPTRYSYKPQTEINPLIIELLKSHKWIVLKNGEKKLPEETTKDELLLNGFAEKSNDFYWRLGINYLQTASVVPNNYTPIQNIVKQKSVIEQIEEEFSEDEQQEMIDYMRKKKKRKEQASSRGHGTVNGTTDGSLLRDEIKTLSSEGFFGFNIDNAYEPEAKESPDTTSVNVKASASQTKTYEDIVKRQELENTRELKMMEIRDELATISKYSYKWFSDLLELEYGIVNEDPENVDTIKGKSLSINFSKVENDIVADNILVLKQPSRPIPLELEEMEYLEVNFEFSNMDETKIKFDVMSVKDFTLRVRVKSYELTNVRKIDWNRCTKASINTNNPIDLLSKWKSAFHTLQYDDEYDMKAHLPKDMRFIFGPPGTGKTTTIKNEIVNLLNGDEKECRILVLAPTNKACDVLMRKIMDDPRYADNLLSSIIGRFVATGDTTIEEDGLVVDRDFDFYDYNKCCLISTITRLSFDGFTEKRLTEIDWDYVFVDEASMIPLFQSTYAIYAFPNAKIIISGDPFQIEPIVREQMWKDENIYKMVNLRSFRNPTTEPYQFDITLLGTQYRSIPAIGELFSAFSYEGCLSHNRTEDIQQRLNVDGNTFKPINVIGFKVDKYDTLYGPRKLSASPVQIYSALFTVEFVEYIERNYASERSLKIGVICPYASQAQFINKLIEQRTDARENVEISVGTIHGFQGDECDVVVAVFNPPVGIGSEKYASKSFVNRQNIVNVAISRARDCLFVLMPDTDTYGFQNLKKLGGLVNYATTELKDETTLIHSTELEKRMFDDSNWIDRNTFVTSHQLANVYGDSNYKYEVRIDESAVDIQFEHKADDYM